MLVQIGGVILTADALLVGYGFSQLLSPTIDSGQPVELVVAMHIRTLLITQIAYVMYALIGLQLCLFLLGAFLARASFM